MTQLPLSAVFTLPDGRPLDPVRIARILSGIQAVAERMGCEVTITQQEAEQE